MKLIRNLLITTAVGLLASSCATFPNNRVSKLSSAPVTTSKKVSLSYSFKAGNDLTGSREEFAPAVTQKLSGDFTTSLQGTQRFTSVSQGKGGAVHVDVDFLNYGNGASAMISGFISGFTFLTIPGVATDNYKVTATVRSASGKTRQYVLDDGATTVFWLPLIVATPFSSPMTVAPEVQKNLYLHVVQNMENDGIIPKAGR